MVILNGDDGMKKGFTLVELLAVIVLLALLATIAVPSAFTIGENIRKDMYCDKVEMIITDAERWGSNHLSQLNKSGTCYKSMTILDLINEGVIKRETDEVGIENPYTGESMDNLVVGVYYKNNRAYAFLNETNEDLKNICETEVRFCEDGESERQGGKIVCLKRPKNACS